MWSDGQEGAHVPSIKGREPPHNLFGGVIHLKEGCREVNRISSMISSKCWPLKMQTTMQTTASLACIYVRILGTFSKWTRMHLKCVR